MEHHLSFQEYHLDCGLRLLHCNDHNPIVYAGYAIKTGAGNDPRNYHGLAHVVEHMLFKGTHLRNARQIIERVEEIGADINAYTTKDNTFVHAVCPAPYTGRIIHVLTDLVLNSLFPDEELEKEKSVIIEEIQSYEDVPSELIFDEFENLIFRGTPAGHNILGSRLAVGRVSTQVLHQFINRYYFPGNMVFCLRGDVDMDSLIDRIEYAFARRFGNPLHRRIAVQQQPTRAKQPTESSFFVSRRKQTSQAHRIIGCLAPSLFDGDRFALVLLNNILGGPAMSARLNLLLREEHGLVYNVESSFSPMIETGLFTVYFGCSYADLEQATQLTHEVLDHFCTHTMSSEELNKAKRQIAGQLSLSADNREGSFLTMAKNYLHYHKVSTMDEMLTRLSAISPEEIRQVAQKYLSAYHRCTLTYR